MIGIQTDLKADHWIAKWKFSFKLYTHSWKQMVVNHSDLKSYPYIVNVLYYELKNKSLYELKKLQWKKKTLRYKENNPFILVEQVSAKLVLCYYLY